MKSFLRVLVLNLVLLLIFGLFALGVLELGLRFFMAVNQETISAVGIPIYQVDGAVTYSHRPGAIAHNGYGDPTPQITINAQGLRDTEDFDPTKHQHNILMLGDSFVFGTGVGDGETFSEILDRKLGSDVHVWNAGHIGHSIGEYYLLLKRYVPILKPQAVVVNIFVANDITELRRKDWVFKNQDMIRVEDQKVFANQDAKLESWESPTPAWYSLWWLKKRWDILAYKTGLKDPRGAKPTLTWPVFLPSDHPAWDPSITEYWRRFIDGMGYIQKFADSQGIPVIFSLIPMDVQVDEKYDDKYAIFYFDAEARAADRPQKKIRDACKDYDLECLDPLPIFRAHKLRDQLYFSHNADPHFDRLGHKIYADFLRESGLGLSPDSESLYSDQ